MKLPVLDVCLGGLSTYDANANTDTDNDDNTNNDTQQTIYDYMLLNIYAKWAKNHK